MMCVFLKKKTENKQTNKQIKTKTNTKTYKIIFRPEHAEDINDVYVVNQMFEFVSDLFA